MDIWLLVAVLASLTVVNYWRSRSVLYPPFAFSAMWLVVLLVYQAGLLDIYPLHEKLLLLVGVGAAAFSLGGEFARLIPAQLINTPIKIGSSKPPRKVHVWKVLMLLSGILEMVLVAHLTISNGLRGGSGSILANARSVGLANSGGDTGIIGILSAYGSEWENCAALMFLLERRDRWFWAMATTALITAIFTTGRGPVLQIFIMLVTAQLFKTGRLKIMAALKFARTPILIFFALYIGLTFTNKDTSALKGGVFGIIIYFVVGYMIGPLAALDYVIQHSSEYASDPNHTFKLFLKIGASLHQWSYIPPPLFDRFIEVPFPTNVYTGYKFYFTDFGFIGCIVAVGIIGFVHTAIYRKALANSTLALYMLSLLTFFLVMFVFDDLYSAAGQIICAVFFGLLYMLCRPLRLFPPGAFRNVRVKLYPKRYTLGAGLNL